MFAVLVAGMLTFIGVDSRKDPVRLQSLCGIAVLLFLGFIFSAYPRKVGEKVDVRANLLNLVPKIHPTAKSCSGSEFAHFDLKLSYT